MKNTFKVKAIQRIAGVIAIVAIIGFSVVACSDNSSSSGGTGGTGNNGGSSNKFAGTAWNGDQGTTGSFDANTWTAKSYGIPSYNGTYTVSGNTITFTVTWADPTFAALFNFRTGDTLTATIINENTFRDDRWRETFTKVR
jgi:hypothetical protein